MRKIWLWSIPLLVGAVLLVLLLWRLSDNQADRDAWESLISLSANTEASYSADLVADLPEPAQRYFNYTIQPGARLTRAIELEMVGELGMGTKADPDYQPMVAHQILVPPHGLVWKVKSGPLSGSDGVLPNSSWTRFWLFGLVPIVRAGGPDHRRSAYGRVVAEAAFWVPASLLPGEHVRWEAVDESTARAIVVNEVYSQAVDITVDRSGAPTQVVIQRWSNENPERTFREQPFGGFLSDFTTFNGYRLPTRVEGGNHFGTAEYFPFFKAEVTEFRFLND